MSAASASGAGPPNMPECTSEASASTVTTTLAMPAQADGRGRLPDRRVPRVAHQDRVRSQHLGVRLDVRLETAGALLLRPLDDELQVHRDVVAERSQRERCMTMLPLQSAAPRPYQRPSTSVSSNGGVRHAASSSGGCTS